MSGGFEEFSLLKDLRTSYLGTNKIRGRDFVLVPSFVSTGTHSLLDLNLYVLGLKLLSFGKPYFYQHSSQ